MIVLDTNVISETMRPEPDANVMNWLNSQPAAALFITSITLAELSFGIEVLPQGQRKLALTQWLADVKKLFVGRILPFDDAAAASYGVLAAQAKRAGKGFPLADGMIAATADSRGFKVATRDSSAFEAVGLRLINPWS
ncbi:MAG: type II toxin-antitoxin system VapC family toxin [Thiomicrospira sp.]|jgi:predicted nucleic acid-binding protein